MFKYWHAFLDTNHICYCNPCLFRKVFEYWEFIQLKMQRLVFQNSNFCWKVQLLSLAINCQLFSLLLFSHSVMSDSLWAHGLQHSRFPQNPHHLSELAQTQVLWVSDAIQPSHPVTSFSCCPQSFPASGSFPLSQLFASGGQSIIASASTLVLPVNIQGWLPSGLTGLISLQSKWLSRVSSSTQFKSINSSMFNLLCGPTLTSIHDYWENHSFDYPHFVSKLISLFFNTLSRFVIAFLPRNKEQIFSLKLLGFVLFFSSKNECLPDTKVRTPLVCLSFTLSVPWR